MDTPGARRISVPRAIALAEGQQRPDYASAFALPLAGPSSRTPEQWARAVFEDAPPSLRALVVFGWTAVLRLRLGPSTSTDSVLGWKIEAGGTEPASIELTASSPLLEARNIVAVGGSVVEWVTLVRYESPLARPLWTTASLVHHQVIPFLLDRAGDAVPEA